MPNYHPKVSNLKPAQKGEVRNPTGGIKMPHLKTIFLSELRHNKDGKNGLERIVKAMVDKALDGDIKAAELIFDRVFGKVVQVTDSTIRQTTLIDLTGEFVMPVDEGITPIKILSSEIENDE